MWNSNAAFINALPYVMENGCRRRTLPKGFGNWFAVYALLCRWSRSGVLERLFRRLKGYRRIPTRFDKLDVMLLSFALVVEMIYDLA